MVNFTATFIAASIRQYVLKVDKKANISDVLNSYSLFISLTYLLAFSHKDERGTSSKTIGEFYSTDRTYWHD